ncbi:MAG: hypothetical protein EBE86_008530, partial [Hormoscilla sp. GUM202]|nr:hypothetical protein [Hormoscilla sp. GUM202]
KKRKIGSCGSKEKELATVSTAPECVVGSGLADCKDGAVNVEQESTQVCTQWDASSPVRAPVASGEQLLCSPLGGETVLTAPECVPVRDIVGKNILDVSGKGSARSHLPTLPAIVEKQTIQFSEELGPQTAAVSAARKTVPVTVGEKHSFFSGSVAFLAKVCEKIKEVCGQGFARSKEIVRAGSAIGPVVVDRKPDYVRINRNCIDCKRESANG